MRIFDGSDYEHKRDYERLNNQIGKIFNLMKDGKWRTLSDIAKLTESPESSASAQLRNLRKRKFGGYTINKQHIKNGLFAYQLELGEGS